MNKKSLAIAGVIVVGLLLIGGFVLMNNTDDNSGTNIEPAANNPSETNTTLSESEQTSLAKLFANKENLTCSFSYSEENSNIEGVGYFAGGDKMRVDYSGQFDGTESNFGTIVDGNTSYFWDNNTKEGYITKVDPGTLQPSDDSTTSNSQNLDTNKDIDFKCSKWSVDSSKFNEPTNVKFTDFSKIEIPTIPDQL